MWKKIVFTVVVWVGSLIQIANADDHKKFKDGLINGCMKSGMGYKECECRAKVSIDNLGYSQAEHLSFISSAVKITNGDYKIPKNHMNVVMGFGDCHEKYTRR